MEKRAEISLWFLLELVAAILVGYMAADLSVAYAQNTIYEKLNLAKDFAMQIDALSGVPGDGYIITNNLHGYSVYFKDNSVEVFDDSQDLAKGTYGFVKNGDSKIDIRLIKPKQVVISKIDDRITISEEIP